jgi:UDP-N-acetylmuramyl pentapeptide phosphotransferase/UDP-N-acetylglucosamine-1-phosphate transferase
MAILDQLLKGGELYEFTNGGVATLIICIFIVLSKSLHGRYTIDDRRGPQKIHQHPTPRVGGLAIAIGLLISYTYAPIGVRALLEPMMIATLPAFLFGLAEDLSRRVHWRERLLATICSGALVWWLTGITIARVDLPAVDYVLGLAPVAVLFTAFAIGGVANAFNMIDGLHGLSAGTAIICISAIGTIAGLQADVVLAHLCLTVGTVLLGFLLINFPFGKIFLGDGGAYLVGFLVGWMAVLLSVRNPQVSPFASLVILAYPVTEVLASIVRRRLRAHTPAHPDRLHLHSLMRVRFSRKLFAKVSSDLQNALVTPVIWLGVGVSAVAAVAAYRNTRALILILALTSFAYVAAYVLMFGRSRRTRLFRRFVKGGDNVGK